MSKWVVSDLHLGHKGMVRFTNPDGSKVRPWDNVDDMNTAIIANWNKVVRNEDVVYVLGDVVMNRRALPLLACLTGRKKLIGGNHDTFRLHDEYDRYFEWIGGAVEMGSREWGDAKVIATHIPVHPMQFEHRFVANLHGHLHGHVIEDKRYINVCLEHTGFAPLAWDVIVQRVKDIINPSSRDYI